MVDRQLRARGVRCPQVLAAMAEVPRERFLPPGMESSAYLDQALPLAEGQTVSQPYMVAVMTEALSLEGTDRVLEIGTGSGYQTAILSRLSSEVFSVERLPALSQRADGGNRPHVVSDQPEPADPGAGEPPDPDQEPLRNRDVLAHWVERLGLGVVQLLPDHRQ